MGSAIKPGERVAQDVLLTLAHRVARQLVDEHDALRQLEPREPPAERVQDRPLIDRPLVRRPLIRAHDDRRDGFAEISMRNADDSRFEDSRYGVDLVLDLFRVDVEAPGDHEVLAAPKNMQIAALADPAEIAGDEEAVTAKLGRG